MQEVYLEMEDISIILFEGTLCADGLYRVYDNDKNRLLIVVVYSVESICA